MAQENNPILTTEETVEILRSAGMKISHTTVQNGIEQKRFPFWDYILVDKRPKVYIYRRILDEWMERRGLL